MLVASDAPVSCEHRRLVRRLHLPHALQQALGHGVGHGLPAHDRVPAWPKCPLGSAPPRPLRHLRALLAALGSSIHSQKEASPLGGQPPPRVLERAASKAAHLTAFDHPGVRPPHNAGADGGGRDALHGRARRPLLVARALRVLLPGERIDRTALCRKQGPPRSGTRPAKVRPARAADSPRRSKAPGGLRHGTAVLWRRQEPPERQLAECSAS